MSKSDIRDVINKINADHKRVVIARASELAIPYHRRRPTGLLSVDLALGGGWPAGTANHLSGPEGVGKTRLLYKTYAMHQRLYRERARIVHFQIEGAVDLMFMRKQGVQVALPKALIDQMDDEREARGVERFTKDERKTLVQEGGEVDFVLPATMEEFIDIALDLVEKKNHFLLGVDSIAAAMPGAEAKLDTVEDFATRGAHATLMKRFYMHYFPLVGGMQGLNETTLVFINQVIANAAKANAPGPMQKYIKDWTPAGASAGKHGKAIDMLVWGGGKIRKGDKGPVIGKTTNWEIQKGKVGAHDNVTGEFPLIYDQDPWIENAKDLILTARAEGVVVDGKPMQLLAKGDKYDLPPLDELYERLYDDIDLEMLIRRAVLEKRKVQCDYGWAG